MRLLQLALGPNEIVDLHPLVSVVPGLDSEARRRLADAVVALARGTATETEALLEAHGVLFDLTPEMLAVLELETDDLQPVVVAGELPSATHDPARRQRAQAQRALASVDERRSTAREEQLQAQAALTAAQDALDRSVRAKAEVASRAQEIGALTMERDRAVGERRRLEDERARLLSRAQEAATTRAEAEASTAEVRGSHERATARRADLANRLERARMDHDPGIEAAAASAAAALAQIEAEVAAEREAARPAAVDPAPNEPPEPTETPAERLERVGQRIEELEKRLAAFAPSDVQPVLEALAGVRPTEGAPLEVLPEAAALADELDAVTREIGSTESSSAPTTVVGDARRRLDTAREDLIEAEVASRAPELDRDLIGHLEQAHADLLDAIDKADSRFGGARARRRVDELREAERAVLGEMGFTSYSDYMMGYSLLNVDVEQEAALETARDKLAAAEDHWHSLQAETDAELALAEVIERRRVLLDSARLMLRRSVPPVAVADELRKMRRVADAAPASHGGLRRALEAAGVALGDEDLSRDDLYVVADAWLAEAAESPAREEAVREELRGLERERDDIRPVSVPGYDLGDAPVGRSPEEERSARLDEARELARSTAERKAAHLEAARVLSTLTSELAAVDAEAPALASADDAAALVADAVRNDDAARAELAAVEDVLAAATAAATAANEALRAGSHDDGSPSPAQEAVAAMAAAEHSVATLETRATEAARVVADVEAERCDAATVLDQIAPPEDDDEGTLAEEVEWYLLARLAAQRSVSLGGSLPLLLDDALAGFGEDELGHLLGRLERMAQAVQIIVVTNDPSATSWAMAAGGARAAVVRPQPS